MSDIIARMLYILPWLWLSPKAYFTESAAPIDFDAVLCDEDGHAFLVPCSANAQFPRLATLRDDTQEAGVKDLKGIKGYE